ncbi:hypothetical protein [Paenibacillus turpanensis]|uniref:hypothetical protein n=1 Tax=Paenibacillus turpanensis TaxID=2689078 RepID=UPI001409E1F0|nr:hypothetical protein [Paenibacillus turpanensis]
MNTPSEGKDLTEFTMENGKINLDEAKRIILESEAAIQKWKEGGGEELIGYYGVSPIYGLAKANRVELEAQLSKYFSPDILTYILSTHNIVCTNEACGLYRDHEGMYFLDPYGEFSIYKETEEYVDVQVGFQYEGLDKERFPAANGIYRISTEEGKNTIIKVSQSYNDQLYGSGIEPKVEPISHITAFKLVEGNWGVTGKKSAHLKLEIDEIGISNYIDLLIETETKRRLLIKTNLYISDEDNGSFTFDSKDIGRKVTGELSISDDGTLLVSISDAGEFSGTYILNRIFN